MERKREMTVGNAKEGGILESCWTTERTDGRRNGQTKGKKT